MKSPKQINEKPTFSRLELNGLILPVFLGWEALERQQEQTIELDIEIHFKTPPHACVSDKLEDTFCYSKIADTLHEKIARHTFHLIEHTALRVYELIKTQVPENALVIVHLRKLPHILGLTKGVRFTYGDTAC